MTTILQKGDLSPTDFTNNNSANAGGIGVNLGAGSPVLAAITTAAADVGNVSAGSNISITGTGSAASPLVINASVETFESFPVTGTITVGSIVSLLPDGTIEATNAGNVESWLGVAKTATAPAQVWLNGQTVTGLTGLTPSTPYYVSDAGTLTSTANARPIGRALSATTLRIEYVGNEV